MTVEVKVSVITRTRNRPQFLKRARAGLATQTFKDFEWIIVNDGGNPTELDVILGQPVDALHGIHRLDLPESLGRGGAAKAGLSKARGEYCILHDDDDALLPEALQFFVNTLDNTPEAVAAIGGTEIIHEKTQGNTYAQYGTSKTSIPKAPPLLIDLAYRNSLLTISTVFRQSAYKKAGGINPNLDVLEDWDLWLRLMLEGDIAVIPELLSVQYIRTNAIGDDAHSTQERHMHTDIELRNHYLRQDIKNGIQGLGWLMNLHHRQTLEELSAMTRTLRGIKKILTFWRGFSK